MATENRELSNDEKTLEKVREMILFGWMFDDSTDTDDLPLATRMAAANVEDHLGSPMRVCHR